MLDTYHAKIDNQVKTKTIGTQTINNNGLILWNLERSQFIGLMVEAGKVWNKLNGETKEEEGKEEDSLSNIDSEEDSWLESEEEEEKD